MGRERLSRDAFDGITEKEGSVTVSYYKRKECYACPRCSGSVVRIKRRLRDRLLSMLFVKVHRFRCEALGCSWEGNRKAIDTPRRLESSNDFVQQPH